MTRTLKWLRSEFRKALPCMIFFFIAFALADLSGMLLHKRAAVRLGVVAVSALVMGKVMVIADQLPGIGMYAGKPLIYSTVWQSLFYWVCSVGVRLIERMTPPLVDGKGLAAAWLAATEALGAVGFWVAQLWLFVLLVVFVAARELTFAVGVERVRKLFWGR